LADLAYAALEEYRSTNSIEAVILDNTATNTGHHNGLCACLEKKLGRKIHMVGCLLHLNELPLRHLIKQLDGETISGNKLSGPIGQQLGGDFYRHEPVNFVPVPTTLIRPPENVIQDLSTDQRLLLEYMSGISAGNIDVRFIKFKPGPVNHARWLTTAIRILILYTRTAEPTGVHKLLVQFIQTIYGPFWFKIKAEKSFTKAPKILFDMLQAVKGIDTETQLISGVLQQVFKRSAFAFLGENFLASLLYSDQEQHRQIAVNKILNIRQQAPMNPVSTAIPKLNFTAEDWSTLIDVDKVSFEPPCTRRFSVDELNDMVILPGCLPAIPIHTQSVERAVKLTTDACYITYSREKHHELIVAKLRSRKNRKRCDSKKDYN
jgi:hypothetical protein